MGREIKFRAWDSENNCKKLSIGKLELFDDMLAFRFDHFDQDPENIIFEQFTGLRDKNGREIYEGDIYDGENGIEEVWFEDGFFGSGKRHSNPIKGDYFGGIIVYEDGCASGIVIGNIHENPELLEPNN